MNLFLNPQRARPAVSAEQAEAERRRMAKLADVLRPTKAGPPVLTSTEQFYLMRARKLRGSPELGAVKLLPKEQLVPGMNPAQAEKLVRMLKGTKPTRWWHAILR